jgi:hypothetical protein
VKFVNRGSVISSEAAAAAAAPLGVFCLGIVGCCIDVWVGGLRLKFWASFRFADARLVSVRLQTPPPFSTEEDFQLYHEQKSCPQ